FAAPAAMHGEAAVCLLCSGLCFAVPGFACLRAGVLSIQAYGAIMRLNAPTSNRFEVVPNVQPSQDHLLDAMPVVMPPADEQQVQPSDNDREK
ncbi:MAG: hypothetical protein AAGK78_16825, partial [Planctomycetota bacterium]